METTRTDQGSSPDFELIHLNARRLTEQYFEFRELMNLRRTLEECLANERQKVSDIYVTYLPYLDLSGVKFLRGEYFLENSRFIRFQEVPEKYFMNVSPNYYFISHRWLSRENPDPNGEQFALLSGYLRNLTEEVVRTWGFWYDFSCIPQRDVSGQRSEEDEKKFQAALKVMHLLPMLSASITIFDTIYLNRAWCFMEWVCATRISPVLAEETYVPLFNHIKFRHLALLVLFLMKDDDYRVGFMSANDITEQHAVAHLNSLTMKSIATCVSTIPNDKLHIASMLYEHFWNHVRLLGFRTQLMTAWRLMERFDKPTIEAIFLQFLIISEDPAMNWTTEETFVLESAINGLGNPTKMIFNRQEILKRSGSSITYTKEEAGSGDE